MARIYTANETFQRPGLPPVVKALLVLNVLAFVLFNLFSLAPGLYNLLALQPGTAFQPWQLITHAFLHGGFTHILFNMFALWMFGAAVEREFGSGRFTLFYLVSAIGGGLAHWLLVPDAAAVGASGAIYGVMAAFGLLYPDAVVFLYFVPIKGKYLVPVFFVMELFLGVSGAQMGVANFAHLGGLVAGYLYMAASTRSLPGFSALFHRRLAGADESRTPPVVRPVGPTQAAAVVPATDDLPRREAPVVEEARIVRETPKAEIDRVLAKIASDGMASLTPAERDLLLSATRR